jgi:hypothetical protein
MRKMMLTAIFLACFAFAANAQAKPLPSHAAVDQYTEGVPTAKGQRSEQGGGGSLPPRAAGPLAALGKDGAAAAATARATAPSPVDGASSQTSGMGIWLWLLLAGCLLAALTFYMNRRRTSSPTG